MEKSPAQTVFETAKRIVLEKLRKNPNRSGILAGSCYELFNNEELYRCESYLWYIYW